MKISRFIFIGLIISIIASFSVSTVAHSGKIDGAGGHYDRDSGDYHYHHGYSAHEHSDMDGDGVKDCPYNFNDKTSHSITTNNADGDDNVPIANSNVPTWIIFFILVMAITSIAMIGIIITKCKKVNEQQTEIIRLNSQISYLDRGLKDKEHRCMGPYLERINDLTSQVSLLKKQVEESQAKLSKKQQIIECMEQSPTGIKFADDGLPIFWKKSDDKPYGDYTVFRSPKSKVYHTDRFCASYSAKREHIFNVIDKGIPCKKCAEGFFEFTSVPDWYTNKPKSNKYCAEDTAGDYDKERGCATYLFNGDK